MAIFSHENKTIGRWKDAYFLYLNPCHLSMGYHQLCWAPITHLGNAFDLLIPNYFRGMGKEALSYLKQTVLF